MGLKSISSVLLTSCLLLSACDSPLTSHAQANFQVIEFTKQGGQGCSNTGAEPDINARCALVHLSYPQLTNPDQQASTSLINQFITTEVLTFESEQGQTPVSAEELATLFINDYLKQPNVTKSWSLDRNMAVLFATDELVTLRFSEFSNTDDVHPAMGQTFYSLDRKTGKPLRLSDVLVDDYQTSLNQIGERLFRANRKIPANATLESQGFQFKAGSFTLNSNVGITQQGLVFYFNNYEISPYEVGPTELLIPYSEIRPLIRPNGVLAALS